MKQTFITKSLLFDYFAGQLTALQRSLIENWAKEAENEEFFFECLHEWETTKPMYQADILHGIEQFKTKPGLAETTTADEFDNAPKQPKTFNWRNWAWGLSAASFLLISFFTVLYYQEHIFVKTFTTGFGQTQSLVLEDGSNVTLNANSSLTVPHFGFGSSTRTVFLKGEANFSVIHTQDNKRFIVRTGSSFDVEVLGTEFTVMARGDHSKVILTRGKVNIQYKSQHQRPKLLTMHPGELVSVNSGGRIRVKKITHPENYSAWKQNRFVFDNTSLNEIVTLLHDNYGLDAKIADKELSEYTLSGSFQAHNADELLQALSEILSISISHHNKQVVFKINH
ncbi:FecR family protein [Runella sp.]|uniref:FecR family protein n=1 Tax=Runella sp. TaxID=1960881 RepID=UPI003D0ECC38